MKVNNDNGVTGPWSEDPELKEKIEKEGISGTTIADEDPDYDGWSKDLHVLHIPTGRVNAYSCYYELTRGSLTIFNGFYQEPLEHPLEEFKYIYK